MAIALENLHTRLAHGGLGQPLKRKKNTNWAETSKKRGGAKKKHFLNQGKGLPRAISRKKTKNNAGRKERGRKKKAFGKRNQYSLGGVCTTFEIEEK